MPATANESVTKLTADPTQNAMQAMNYANTRYSELDQITSPRRAVTLTLTREPEAGAGPPGPAGRRGRVDAALLAEVGWSAASEPRCFVCGPTPFVEAVARSLVELGHRPSNIRTERFGPTGG